MTRWEFMTHTIGNIIGALAAIWLFSGCVTHHAHVAAPSNAKVQAGINSAQASNLEAQSYNAKAKTKAKRIEDKVIVIEKYWDKSK